MKKKEIVYPIFLQVSLHATDQFWMYLFEDLAYGICPYGTYFDNDVLCCRFKNKEFNFQFTNKEPYVIYTKLYNILRTKLKLTSKIDKYNQRVNFYRLLEDKRSKQWVDIKKKNIKDVLIENYVIDMKLKYFLSKSQMKKLLSVIMIGFQFKLLNNKDVEYDPIIGKISNITGIIIKNNKIKLSNTLDIIPEFELYEQPKNQICMKDNWDKYLSQF